MDASKVRRFWHIDWEETLGQTQDGWFEEASGSDLEKLEEVLVCGHSQ